MTVLPGIFEEIVPRVLSGCTRLFPAAVIAVGFTFRLFHISLFLTPTAFLGVLFAAADDRRVVFPAMLWHALNNGINLAMPHYGILLRTRARDVYGRRHPRRRVLGLWRNGTSILTAGGRGDGSFANEGMKLLSPCLPPHPRAC
jgi:hypothetical protein